MFYHVQNLINPTVDDQTDAAAANAPQEGLEGQFCEVCPITQYLFQSFNFRGDGIPYLDLIQRKLADAYMAYEKAVKEMKRRPAPILEIERRKSKLTMNQAC